MIYPSIPQLTHDKFNRYTLVIATAICARKITDLINGERDRNEKFAARTETGSKIPLKAEIIDQKPVKSAINGIHRGDYIILERDEDQ